MNWNGSDGPLAPWPQHYRLIKLIAPTKEQGRDVNSFCRLAALSIFSRAPIGLCQSLPLNLHPPLSHCIFDISVPISWQYVYSGSSLACTFLATPTLPYPLLFSLLTLSSPLYSKFKQGMPKKPLISPATRLSSYLPYCSTLLPSPFYLSLSRLFHLQFSSSHALSLFFKWIFCNLLFHLLCRS